MESTLSPRSEAILAEIILLRRERIRLDRRIRELIALDWADRNLDLGKKVGRAARDSDASPVSEPRPRLPSDEPCHCLRCDYAWYPNNPDRAPKCCSRCGSSKWMLPPEPGCRKPGDPPAPSWTRRQDPRTRLAEHAKRMKEERAERERANGTAERIDRVAARAKEQYPWDRPLTLPPREPSTPMPMPTIASPVFPPPPDIARVLPPPPEPSAVSLSARLAEYRRQDDSPEQPERTVSVPPPPIIEETVHITEVGSLTEEEWKELPEAPPNGEITIVSIPPMAAAAAEEIPEYVPAESVGAPATDAEREELEKARVEAWPTTRPDD